MSVQDKRFYVWTMTECIKSTYEWWGIDMMSMFSHIKKNFPNATKAINKMYNNLEIRNYYEATPMKFENPQFVYEAISSLVPANDRIRFDLRTKEQSKEYNNLNMCSWNRFIFIRRINLLMAVLLFTEEFILQPITSKNVVLKDNKLIVYGNFVTLKVSKHQDKTYISIRIRNVMLLEYVILN